MESTPDAQDHSAVGDVVAAAIEANLSASKAAAHAMGATPTSVGLWGPTGHGKTALAASLLSDPGYTPALYIDIDFGRTAVAGYEAADLLVHKPARTLEDVTRLIRDVGGKRIKNRAGQPVRSVIVDALSNLQANEIGARGLSDAMPKDQAQKIIQPFRVLFGHLRSLPLEHGCTVVTICHAKDKAVKISADDVREFCVPSMFNSVATPWMESVRHLWRITKTRGKRGPAFPLMMLRTEPDGVYGTPLYVKFMKTSNIAFAQWVAGEYGKRECLEWDTGELPLDQHPTLAQLLRVAEELSSNQGTLAAQHPAALRALSALQAAMDAAGAA